MCGIAGIVRLEGKQVELSELKKMTDVIAHRGPDGEGHWINANANVGLGHRRLSIIDLSDKGKQPMHFANSRYTITFNGEIYNYVEIKNDLIKKGYSFLSESDTEVLLALYHDKKEKCLQELDGMFAFAIWDEQEQRLFCARDRFGEKPFHYYHRANQFVFASEIKQFWQAGITKIVDQKRLMTFVEKGTVDDPNDLAATFFETILKLDAAHYLTLDATGKLTLQRYWSINLNATPFSGTIEQAADQFLSLFIDSIRLRLRSDVPVGSSLSGGLDSSSIVMLIDLLKGKELKQNTFSARFENFAKDEGQHIEAVVKACKNVAVHYTWPDKDYFQKTFDKVTYYQDEPYGSASVIAQYAVMELAKQHGVTVLLDGQGADEQLAGYLGYYHGYLHQLHNTKLALYKKEIAFYNQFHGQAYTYVPFVRQETLRMKLGRYRRTMLGQPLPYDTYLNTLLKQSTADAGLKELLRFADRNSMAHSREVRLPFLSHKLVEFVFSLPDRFKINAGWTKFVLRKAMDSILPHSICWRIDKIGYEPPQKSWMQPNLFEKDIARTARLLNIQRVNEAEVKHVFTQEWRLLMVSKYI
jgi:asparagine synthase (glutamine-hydrolysing)